MATPRIVWVWSRRLIVIVVSLLAVLLIVGFSYERVSRSRVASEFPPPGRLVSVDGYDMHLVCSGEGSPTVILESGLTLFASLQWFEVQPEIARSTTVCSYDRAGLMWSDRNERPRSGEYMVAELQSLLDTADIQPPYVMVAHSLGGLLSRMYDHHFPNEISGFVFIDSSHPEQLERLPPAGAGPGVMPAWFTTLLAETGVTRLMTSSDRPSGLPAAVYEPAVAYIPQKFRGLVLEREAVIETVQQSQQLDWSSASLGSRPIVVLTRGEFDSEQQRSVWVEMQEELAALSSHNDHRIVDGAEHSIHIDDPDAVIEAIGDVVVAIRTGRSVNRNDSQ
jgi:pimeloyl-ACP methyl ester carboxylesterase